MVGAQLVAREIGTPESPLRNIKLATINSAGFASRGGDWISRRCRLDQRWFSDHRVILFTGVAELINNFRETLKVDRPYDVLYIILYIAGDSVYQPLGSPEGIQGFNFFVKGISNGS